MEREDFAKPLFRVEELLIDGDYWRRQISDCKYCRGWAEEDYRNPCPACLRAVHEEFKAMKKVSGSTEMKEASRNLKEALGNDAAGELVEIIRLERRTTIN